MFDDLTVVIPTLNEGKNIGVLLDTINRNCSGCRIIVVDDGSVDATRDIILSRGLLNKRIVLVDRSKEKVHGLTASVVDAVLQVKTKYFLVMDGDLQHPPEKIIDFYALLDGGAFLVVGTRAEIVHEWSFFRKLLSRTATFLGNKFIDFSCNDIMSGFFAGQTVFFKKIISANKHRYELRGYKVLFDTLKVIEGKIPYAEVPYVFDARRQGESKMGLRQVFFYIRSLMR
ncbi:glycosyltransferase [Candidatus Woesearchaeota archaeon]|nr:glycosyltransferase [Candidatus Woesearchaeota archaeon]